MHQTQDDSDKKIWQYVCGVKGGFFFSLYSGLIYSINGLAQARLLMGFYAILFYFVDLFGLGRSMLTQPLLPWNWSLLATLDLSATSPDVLLLFFPS
jgi:hypothetical protein